MLLLEQLHAAPPSTDIIYTTCLGPEASEGMEWLGTWYCILSSEKDKRTNVQQLTRTMVWSFSFYSLFNKAFVLFYPPPRRKYYENNSPRIILCNFGGRLR